MSDKTVVSEDECKECRSLKRQGRALGIHVAGGVKCVDHHYFTAREHNEIVDRIHARIMEHFKCSDLTASYVISGVVGG